MSGDDEGDGERRCLGVEDDDERKDGSVRGDGAGMAGVKPVEQQTQVASVNQTCRDLVATFMAN
jgi:hypothetical protein